MRRRYANPQGGQTPLSGVGRRAPARRTRDRARAHRARAGRRGRVALGGEGRPEPSSRRQPRGRSGRRGTWRAPRCAAPGSSPRPRASHRAPCGDPLGPRPGPPRAGAAASRDDGRRPPRSGRDSKSALRTSLTLTPSSSASPCANSWGGRGVPFISLSRAAWTLSASTFSASARRSAKRASCFLWSLSNAAVTLSVEIPSALASEAAKSSRRSPSSLRWKSRSACASSSASPRACRPGPGIPAAALPRGTPADRRSGSPRPSSGRRRRWRCRRPPVCRARSPRTPPRGRLRRR